MQNNSKLDVEDLIKATQRVYESRYENPTLQKDQIDYVEKFVIESSNQLCAKIMKKVNLGLL
ncbi:MAG: hypothetical protein MRY23_04820 [Pelagibacteraceae bacterium]|nr:hypothetical protein [Pelagibacteraceae bacterium]MCI5079099.1 hypothetical protein [Pelagibacteraceae bacterium]